MAKKTLDVIYREYIKEQVEAAGVEYVGIQECEGWAYDLVLFNHSKGSTLAVKSNVDDITDTVRKRLVKYDEEHHG